jgi:hypothetical protein
LPLSGPDVIPAVLIETVKLAGVVPPLGDTLSQVLPEVTAALTGVALPAPIANTWVGGAAPPGVKLNVIEGGVAVSVTLADVKLKVTRIWVLKP